MTEAPRHEESYNLKMELRAIQEISEALSLFDFPDDMSMNDLILLTLKMCDTPVRKFNPELLRETFAKCGKFGVVAIEGAVKDTPPYVHMGSFGDAIDRLFRQGHVVSVEDVLTLSETGQQMGDQIYDQARDLTRDKITQKIVATEASS